MRQSHACVYLSETGLKVSFSVQNEAMHMWATITGWCVPWQSNWCFRVCHFYRSGHTWRGLTWSNTESQTWVRFPSQNVETGNVVLVLMSTNYSRISVEEIMSGKSNQDSENTWTKCGVLAVNIEARQGLSSIHQRLFPADLNKRIRELNYSRIQRLWWLVNNEKRVLRWPGSVSYVIRRLNSVGIQRTRI